MNALRTIRQRIYRLKRQYGKTITIYYPDPDTPETVDFETGIVVPTYLTEVIRRAIVQTVDQAIKAFGPNFLAVNKGGNVSVSDRIVIIDAKDLTIAIEDHHNILYSGRWFEISEKETIEDDAIVVLLIMETQNRPDGVPV